MRYVSRSAELLRQLFIFFFAVDSLRTAGALLLSIVSRFSKFLSFLLPFKALLVATNPSMELIHSGIRLTNVELAFGVLILSVVFFLFYSLTRNGVLALGRRVVLQAEGETKLSSVSQPDEVIDKDFREVVTFYTALAVVAILFLAVAVLSPVVAAIIFLCILVCIARLWFSLPASIDGDVIKETTGSIERYFYYTQFAVLISVVYFIVIRQSFSVLIGMFIFIALRQILASVAELIRLILMNNSRVAPTYMDVELDNILAEPASPVNGLPEYLVEWRVESWIRDILGDVSSGARVFYVWRDLGLRYAHSFYVKVEAQTGISKYIFNVYGKRSRNYFKTEEGFLKNNALMGHSLRFLFSRICRDCYVVVLEDSSKERCSAKKLRSSIGEILVDFWSVDTASISAVKNGDAVRAAPLVRSSLDLLSVVAATDSQRGCLRNFQINFKQVEDRIGQLPLALDNPELSSKTAVIDADGTIKCSTWGRVSLEPVGSYLWRLRNQKGLNLEYVTDRLRESRADCVGLTKEDLLFAAAYYGLTKNIQNGYFSAALEGVIQLSKLE